MIIRNSLRLAKLVPGQANFASQITSSLLTFERSQGVMSIITMPKSAPAIVLEPGDIIAYTSVGYPSTAKANGTAAETRPIGFANITEQTIFNPGNEILIKCFGRMQPQHSIGTWPQAGEIAWLSVTGGEVTDSPPVGFPAVPIGIFLEENWIFYNPTIEE